MAGDRDLAAPPACDETAFARGASAAPALSANGKEASAEPKMVTNAAPGNAPQHRRLGRRPAQGTALGLDDVEPAEEEVDGPQLFTEMVAVVNRYMVLAPFAPVVIALWIALTYLTDAVEILPRLLLTSPTRECGKTRLFAILAALVRRALSASSITPAALFRAIQAASPTLLLDEMDNAALHDNPELRALLNSGHSRPTAWAVRCVGEGRDMRADRFSTWAPVAFAAIGDLPDTVASRSVRVPMRRRTPDEPIARMREHRIAAELEPLRRRLARWCQDHAERVRDAEPEMPDGLGDRDADNWTPLLAIADTIGGEWPSLARETAKKLSVTANAVNGSVGELLLADLKGVFGEKPLTARGLAGLLKPFGITSGSLQFGDAQRKGYLRAWFEEAWTRYAPPPGVSIRRGVADRESSGSDALFDPSQEGVHDGCENTVPTAPDAARDTTTDRKPPAGTEDEPEPDDGSVMAVRAIGGGA